MPLLINDVPIQCIHQAAQTYQVPAVLLISILKTENGRVGMASPNKNGTVDLGPMQINSSWLPKLASYGYSQADIQFDACKNIAIGAWILNQDLSNSLSTATGIGYYHSHTPYLNENYAKKVIIDYQKITKLVQSSSV